MARDCDNDDHIYITMKPPSFHVRFKFRDYLKWQDTMEWLFDCHFYSEREKVRLATSKSNKDATNWRCDLKSSRKSYGEEPIKLWYDFKIIMK